MFASFFALKSISASIDVSTVLFDFTKIAFFLDCCLQLFPLLTFIPKAGYIPFYAISDHVHVAQLGSNQEDDISRLCCQIHPGDH